jgi:transposase
VFAREHLAQPWLRGDREAMRVLVSTRQGAVSARTSAINHLKGLVVNSPEELRKQLRPLATMDLIRHCAHLRSSGGRSTESRVTVMAIRSAARRILALGAEADELEAELRADRRQGRASPARGGWCWRSDRRADPLRLVARWQGPFRSGLRFVGRRGAYPSLVRPDGPVPPQPRRRGACQARETTGVG